jgi:radical SAM superfamily enzyme YgiQ (UPF0313 family)
MARIVLTTFNAKYIHAAFGLRYLVANLGALRDHARILEFDIQQRAVDIVERLLSGEPQIVGIGVYIWNAALSLEVVILLKRLAPQIVVVLGGPEVSYEWEAQAIVQAADYLVPGEADLAFASLCSDLLAGRKPPGKVCAAGLPDLEHLLLPYSLYTDQDVAHRVIYVEASRGCPFTCEFCLSSLDVPVRQFALSALLTELDTLLARGVQQFKFVDRTFNLKLKTSEAIVRFFLERYRPGLFIHFEMIPDRLPNGLRELIRAFPAGALQFEVGIQTFNEEVAARIRRRQDYSKLADNLTYLRSETGVHIHADLIVGLPGEDMFSFGQGFNQLVRLGPHEIQVGILKRLRGTPIVRHDAEWGMVYSPHPPYEVLQTKVLSFGELQQMRRFARHWDLVANSGNFVQTAPLLWANGSTPFDGFLRWSEWLHARLGRSHGIALVDLAEQLFSFLTGEMGLLTQGVAGALWQDYQRGGRSDVPVFLRPHVPGALTTKTTNPRARRSLKRQARHHDSAGAPPSVVAKGAIPKT